MKRIYAERNFVEFFLLLLCWTRAYCVEGGTVDVSVLNNDSVCIPGGVSMMRQSMVPQSTSVRNCLMRPFLRGPRQMTASSLLAAKKNKIYKLSEKLPILIDC